MSENTNNIKTFLRKWGFNIGICLTIVSGIFFLGGLNERINNNNKEIAEIKGRFDKLDEFKDEIKSVKDKAIEDIENESLRQDDPVILIDGELSSGYDMGFDSSTKHKDWVKTVSDYIRMEYPKGSTWGAVFVTVGEPTDTSRPYIDLSDYKKVSLELRGEENGETILIGLKDNTDPDDGSETKVRISNITTQWQTYEIELSRFRTANLHKLYVVTELVFERDPKILFLKNIKFLP